MFISMQTKWVDWMRAVTVTVAVLAVLVSALAMSPEINHRVLPAQSAVASVVDAGAADDGAAQPAGDTKCHIGHGCILVIMPSNEMALTRFDSAPESPQITGYPPSVAGYLPFHPPRILSQA